MALQPGARLGPYDVLEKLGEGGMGQVFKARDTRLGRLVAIKQSATQFNDRFEREAQAVAALNHPNICQVYDVGPDYFVMEFLEGRPLAPVESTRKVLDLAVQIADGMAAAHAAGIVHRDLKPDNILVTPDGRVKILDFGVAKAIAGDSGDQVTRPTLTGVGTVVGTVHYMSPEQARGQATLGPQSDQFSFGLILYELVTGKKAFARDSSAETLTAIIREDAPPLPANVPAPLRWIIERLLAKDPADRYDSSRDLYRELKQLRDRLSDATAAASSVTTPAVAATLSKPRAGWRLALLTALAGAAIASVLSWAVSSRNADSIPDLGAYRFTPLSLDPATEGEPAWSPDGRTLAYTATVDGVQQVMVREIGATAAVQLTRGPSASQLPFWAPDGTRVYFLRAGSPARLPAIWSVSAVGGEPEPVIEGATSAALHPHDGRFVFVRAMIGAGSDAGRLFLFDPSKGPDAGAPQPFGQTSFKVDAVGLVSVFVQAFSPDGTKLAVLNNGTLWLIRYPEGAAREIRLRDHPEVPFLGWMPDSRHIVTSRLQDGQGVGISIVDTERGTSRTILSSQMGLLDPRVSPDGKRLAFVAGENRWKLIEVALADGRARELASGSRASMFPTLNPDGTRLAFSDVSAGSESYIREMTLAPTGETVARTIAAIEGRVAEHVQWSPDGARVLFSTLNASGSRLMIAPAAGGRALPVDPAASMSRGGVWSADGTQIAYRRQIGDENQIVTVRVGTSTAPNVVKRWPTGEPFRLPLAWSPDGRWILISFAGTLSLLAPDGSSERQLFSTPGTTEFARPVFSRDGRELLTLRRDRSAPGRPWRLFATDVASGAERVMTTLGFPRSADNLSGLSLSPDGKRLYTSYADAPYDIWMLEGF